jgi:hypothetical protein
MKPLSTLFFIATLLPLAWIAPAAAEPSRSPSNMSLAQVERMAVDLKQGMSLDEVQRMLGKPRRTALRNDGASQGASPGTLQWTYTWGSVSQASLQVEFSAKTAEQWTVNSWQWATY